MLQKNPPRFHLGDLGDVFCDFGGYLWGIPIGISLDLWHFTVYYQQKLPNANPVRVMEGDVYYDFGGYLRGMPIGISLDFLWLYICPVWHI